MKPTPVRRILWVVAILVVLCVLMAGLAQAQPVVVTDDRGRTVQLPRPPQRIVSILPSLTETVCALDRCGLLVGVDRYSNWPESVQTLPKVGGGMDPSVEAIVALRPDVVLVSSASRVAPRLESLGLPVVVLEPRNHADVQRVILTMGTLLGVSDAQRIWRNIDAGVKAAAQSVPERVRGTRVYFEVNAGPYAAGPTSFIGETLTRLGAGNIVPASLGPFPKLNPEYVVRANPQLIMVGARSADGLTARPGWHAMQAVRQGHICVFPIDVSDVLVRPGPRMAEAARAMAQCLADYAQAAPAPAQRAAAQPGPLTGAKGTP